MSVSAIATEKGYENRDHQRGAVAVPVPTHFTDLSTVHHSLGSLSDQSTRREIGSETTDNLSEDNPEAKGRLSGVDWRSHKLSEEQVDQFWRDGYLSNVPVLTQQQVQLLLNDYKTFLDPIVHHEGHGLFYEFHRNQSGNEDNVLLHALGQWRMSKVFHDLCFLPQIVCPAAQLVDPSRKPCRLRLWHDQLFAKPPHHGGVVAWHQDYSYWTRTKPMMHITVHIALDDQTGDRGGLQFVPGSHRWHREGMPLPITDASFRDMSSILSVLTEEERESFTPVSGNLRAGEASFHHPLTVHGSHANKSEYPRRSAVVNYIGDGVVSDTDTPLLTGVPVIPPGHRVEGQFFPLVYDPLWTL